MTEKDLKSLAREDWIVTEKVHGANFSFIYEDNQLQYAKRKELLAWSDDFFGFQLVVEEIEHKLYNLFESIKANHPFKKCTVYGELFGGSYPHSEVRPDKRVSAIQTGVYYSPTIRFYAFDIALEPADSTDYRYYLDYNTATELFETCDLFYAKPLFTGKLHKALKFDIAFDSTLPKCLGLPPIEDNLVEGVVVKPLSSPMVSTDKGFVRPILKIKNKKFSEEHKFHEARKWSFIPDKPSKKDELDFLLPELIRFVTLNRLHNTISKVGRFDPDNKSRTEIIKQMYMDDVFCSFNEANNDFLDDLDLGQKDWLRNRLIRNFEELIDLL